MSLLLAGGDIVSHLEDTYILGRWLSAHHVLLMIVAGVMIVGFWLVARTATTRTPQGFGSLIEVSLVWLRDDVVYPWLGPDRGRRYLPFLWTLFFFILLSNLLGLFPWPVNLWGKTATGNIGVTAALAIITFVTVQVSGMIRHGWGRYWVHIVPGGVPKALFPLVWMVEFLGLFAKPFALTVRLFANMIGGHAILAVLGGFLFGVSANLLVGGLVTLPTLGFMLFIMLFETLVALIQAYIFTVLSAIFISLAVAEEH